MRRSRITFVALCCAFALIALAGCKHDGRTLRPADPSQTASVYTPSTTTTSPGDQISPAISDLGAEKANLAFVLTLPWVDGEAIDARYTCAGAGVQPSFAWLGAPAGAVEMALVVTDTDANDFVHWIIAGLDPKNPSVAENVVPVGAIEARNGFSSASTPNIGWRGPCPPAGTTHHYRFTLYALSQQVELPTGSTADNLLGVIEGSSIEAAQVTGTYSTP